MSQAASRTDAQYVPKRSGDEPWLAFGASREEYEKWVPHICGVCCLKMVGDTLHITETRSLYQLTVMCLEGGAFRIARDGEIEGIFHYPLADVARGLGMEARVARHLSEDAIKAAVTQNEFVLLSVDLGRATSSYTGGHLVLVYGHDLEDDIFLVHDGSSVIRAEGRGMRLSRTELAAISNRKGLILS